MAPLPNIDSNHILPFNNSIILLDIDNPSPVPLYFFLLELSHCQNLSKTNGIFSSGIPIPVSSILNST